MKICISVFTGNARVKHDNVSRGVWGTCYWHMMVIVSVLDEVFGVLDAEYLDCWRSWGRSRKEGVICGVL